MPTKFKVDGWSLPVASTTNIRKFLDGLHLTGWQLTILERQGFLVRIDGKLVVSPPLREAFERRFPSPSRCPDPREGA